MLHHQTMDGCMIGDTCNTQAKRKYQRHPRKCMHLMVKIHKETAFQIAVHCSKCGTRGTEPVATI